MKKQVWVLIFKHKFGTDYDVAPSLEAVDEIKLKWASTYWEMDPLTADIDRSELRPEEIADTFFEQSSDECEVAGPYTVDFGGWQ